jgi:hypothetical protein
MGLVALIKTTYALHMTLRNIRAVSTSMAMTNETGLKSSG